MTKSRIILAPLIFFSCFSRRGKLGEASPQLETCQFFLSFLIGYGWFSTTTNEEKDDSANNSNTNDEEEPAKERRHAEAALGRTRRRSASVHDWLTSANLWEITSSHALLGKRAPRASTECLASAASIHGRALASAERLETARRVSLGVALGVSTAPTASSNRIANFAVIRAPNEAVVVARGNGSAALSSLGLARELAFSVGAPHATVLLNASIANQTIARARGGGHAARRSSRNARLRGELRAPLAVLM
jgi:hypothetical protein